LGEKRRSRTERKDQGYGAAMKARLAARDCSRDIPPCAGEDHAIDNAQHDEADVLLLMRIPPARQKQQRRRDGKQQIPNHDSRDALQHFPNKVRGTRTPNTLIVTAR
jgi:hypothetical protein